MSQLIKYYQAISGQVMGGAALPVSQHASKHDASSRQTASEIAKLENIKRNEEAAMRAKIREIQLAAIERNFGRFFN